MPEIVQFHFLLLAAGEVLKVNTCVTPQDIQNYIQQDEAFAVRVPLDDCRMALKLLEGSGFIALAANPFEEFLNETYMRV